jgi:hypothetical protein
MAHFYGRLQGGRGGVTRTGTKNSGIEVTAESWSTIVRAKQAHVGGSDIAMIDFTTKHGVPMFRATFDAERVARHAGSDPEVDRALENVYKAFRALDQASAEAQREMEYVELVDEAEANAEVDVPAMLARRS